MNISKRKQGILAIICTIAMIVTSITVYNPREVKAADWSTVDTWKTVSAGGIDYKVQKDGSFINDGFHAEGGGSWVNATNVLYMNFRDAAYTKAVINDVEYLSADHNKGTDECIRFEGAQVWISFDLFKFKKNTIVFYNGDTVLSSLYVYNPEGSDSDAPAPTAPVLNVTDFNATTNSFTFTWDDAENASYYDLYVGTTKVAGRVTSGVSKTYSELGLEQTSEDQTIEFILKAVNGTGETASAVVEKTLPKFSWKSIDGTDKYAYNSNTKVNVVNIQGKDGKDSVYMNVPAGITSISVNGKTEAVGAIEGSGFWVYFSALTEEENEVPAGVQTGVEVLEAPTKYTVTEDGVAKEVTEGSSYTFGKNAQGYYDATNGVAYAPEEVITVDRNITVTGIKLNVAMESGAGIKLTTPTGLRFKTNVTGTTDILSQSDIIKTGTIITASDILDGGTVDDNFVKSNKLKLNIENNGWYGNTVGTFCASIVELQEANYARDFVGVGYVTIKYNNNAEKTIYAPSGTVRAVATVAQNIMNSEAIYQDGMTYYNYLKSLNKGYDTIIKTYAAAKKNNQ